MEDSKDNQERMVMIEFRDLRYDDLEFLCETRNDPSTVSFLHTKKCFSVEEAQKWYKESSPRWKIINVNGENIGYIRISERKYFERAIKIGMDIHPYFRRQGLAYFSYHKLFDQLSSCGWRKVWLEVLSNNLIAIALYVKLGFTTDSVQRNFCEVDGEPVDSIIMYKEIGQVSNSTPAQ